MSAKFVSKPLDDPMLEQVAMTSALVLEIEEELFGEPRGTRFPKDADQGKLQWLASKLAKSTVALAHLLGVQS
jgi:hypothetical protein